MINGNQSSDSFSLVWHFQPTEFDRLKTLKTAKGFVLPQDGRISQVYLSIDTSRAVLHTWFYAMKKGTNELSQRRTEQTNLLSDKTWVDHLLPMDIYGYAIVTALRTLWPGK